MTPIQLLVFMAVVVVVFGLSRTLPAWIFTLEVIAAMLFLVWRTYVQVYRTKKR